MPIALGCTLGTTWPMMPAARQAADRAPGAGSAGLTGIGPSRAWQLAAVGLGLLFVAGFGPGMALWRISWGGSWRGGSGHGI